MKESISGNTSDYWNYGFTLTYLKGGPYRLEVAYDCAVNEKGRPDDYCNEITYPNGQKDTGVSPAHTTEVHDLATGSTVNAAVTGFFGTHAAPPPTGSSQVIKFAHLSESAYFGSYGIWDIANLRTWDVCVPNKKAFSGVILCPTSDTGH